MFTDEYFALPCGFVVFGILQIPEFYVCFQYTMKP